MKRFGIGLSIVFLALFLASAASAAENTIDAQLFRPSIFNGNFLAIEDAHTLDAMCYGFGLYVNHSNRVVRVSDERNNFKEVGILNSVTTANLTAAFSPWSWLSLGVDVPYHVMARARRFEDATVAIVPHYENELIPSYPPFENVSTLGDIKGEIKLGILNEQKIGLGLAVAPFATFPTGDAGVFLGEGTTNFGGKLMVEKDFKFLNFALNGGYLYRPTRQVFGTDMGPAYLFGGGVSRTIVGGLSFSVEGFGQQYVASGRQDVQTNPIEVLGTIRYKFGSGLRLLGGGGGAGTDGIGSPAYRFLGGIDYYPHCEGPTQGKLVVNVTTSEGKTIKAHMKLAGPTGELKPKDVQPKKFNVVTDEEGEWRAMMDPGEFAMVAGAIGYQPSGAKGTVLIGKTTYVSIVLKPVVKPTTLQVTVVYKKNQQPIATATLLVKDTIQNKILAPNKTKLENGAFQDKFEPGSYIFSAFAPGFERVDEPFEVVAEKNNVLNLQLRKIIIQIGRVQFDWDSDVIKSESFPILEDVLKKINQQNEEGGFKKLIIEGHTSSEGLEDHNQKLSERRAASVVKWLTQHGISGDKLESHGFGPSRPVADNDTEEGRIQNRRVEFIFEEEATQAPAKEETKKDEPKKDEPAPTSPAQ